MNKESEKNWKLLNEFIMFDDHQNGQIDRQTGKLGDLLYRCDHTRLLEREKEKADKIL